MRDAMLPVAMVARAALLLLGLADDRGDDDGDD